MAQPAKVQHFKLVKLEQILYALKWVSEANSTSGHNKWKTIMPYYVYILISLKDKNLYIGYSTNLKKRLLYHQKGLNISTTHRRPLKLIFYEVYSNKEDALKREGYFKTTAGKRALKIMLNKTLKKFN